MKNRRLAMIVAASENNVIGVDGDLPWKISADLKRFKSLTMGHHIIMGRKTFDSIGILLPGRVSIIVTRQADFRIKGIEPLGSDPDFFEPDVYGSKNIPTAYRVATSMEQAIELCGRDDCPFVTGGAEIYRLAMPRVTEIHLTRVHLTLDGDTMLPNIDWNHWELVSEERHSRDDRNEADFSFLNYRRTA